MMARAIGKHHGPENAGKHQHVEQDESPLAQTVEHLRERLGHEAGQHVAAVERRDGNHVEDGEQHVHLGGKDQQVARRAIDVRGGERR